MNAPSNGNPKILIAGAGPTGLVLALWLARLGVPVRIIDKLAAPEKTSRAIGVQARTLEFYRQLEMAETFIEHGRRAPATNMWVCGRNRARMPYHEMGADISPYPFALVLSQDEHEYLLIEQLAKLGIQVERGMEITGFEETNARIDAQIMRADGTLETFQAAYLVGCDGARSTVREKLKIDFVGDTYARKFYVADVHTDWAAMNGEMHIALGETDFLAVFPLKEDGRARLIGILANDSHDEADSATWDDVDKTVIGELGLKIDGVNWFSTYRVHHRVADHFRAGRVFLAGDAAHIHTPVGGQGMNTGIGDAINLAWKLASVLRGRADDMLLDSYEAERIVFARKLVSATDRVFTGVVSSNFMDRQVRMKVAPVMLPMLFKLAPVREFLFRSISQIALTYRGSSLSEGCAGGVHGGDRLPWVRNGANGAGDNLNPLTSLDWQVHVYGNAGADVHNSCAKRNLPVHVFPWRPEMGSTGLKRDAAYLLRPDGYVALAVSQGGGDEIAAYLDARKLAV